MAVQESKGGKPDPNLRLPTLQSLQQAGRLQEAEAGYRECLRDGSARAAGLLATLLSQQRRDRELADLGEALLAAAPADGELIVNLSVALRRVGRLDEALQHARRGVVLLPAAVPAWNALGVAAMEAGRLDEALAAFDSGLKADGQHPALWLHRAMALQLLQRNQEALPIFAQFTRAFPQVSEAWRGLGAAQEALGQMPAALRSRQQAHALAPRDPDVVFEYASTLFKGGHFKDAARQFEDAVKLRENHAQSWLGLGRARLKLDDVAAARAALERAKSLDANDAGIAHLHAAITGTLPDTVETDYIRNLFDDFAKDFEDALVEQLSYDTPAKLAAFLKKQGADTGERVLDLGCGTGLMAAELARPARTIDGVDLSPRMLEQARAKDLYAELHTGELIEFLQTTDAHWDLIVATDVLIYIPHAAATFAPTLARLTPGGWFGFSIEASGSDATELPPQTGRYRQSPVRMASDLAAAGFVNIARESIVIRLESGKPVAGALLIAQRPSEA